MAEILRSAQLVLGNGVVVEKATAQDLLECLPKIQPNSGNTLCICRPDGTDLIVSSLEEGQLRLLQAKELTQPLESHLPTATATQMLLAFLACDDTELNRQHWQPCQGGRAWFFAGDKYYEWQYDKGMTPVEESDRRSRVRRVLVYGIAILCLMLTLLFGSIYIILEDHTARVSEFFLLDLLFISPLYLIHRAIWRCPICLTRIGLWPGQSCCCSSLSVGKASEADRQDT